MTQKTLKVSARHYEAVKELAAARKLSLRAATDLLVHLGLSMPWKPRLRELERRFASPKRQPGAISRLLARLIAAVHKRGADC